MNEEREIKRYSLRQAGQRSLVMAKIGEELAYAGKLQDFVVQEGETRILSYKIEELQPLYKKIQPQSVDEIKDMLGIPNVIGNCSQASKEEDKDIEKTALKGGMHFRAAMPSRLDITRLRSRIISPHLLSSPDISEKERAEIMDMARMATEAYIYGDSNQVLQWKATVNEYLRLKKALIFIPYFHDITVHNNGTLKIAADTHAVYARKIRLYGNGRILCEGPTTFDCFSFEGFL